MNGLASDYRRFRAECAEAVEAERAGLAGFRAEQEAALAGVKRALLGQIAEAESQNSDLIDEMNQASSALFRFWDRFQFQSSISSFKFKL